MRWEDREDMVYQELETGKKSKTRQDRKENSTEERREEKTKERREI